MIARTPGLRWLGAYESQRVQIKFVHEGIDNAHRVVVGNELIQRFRQQRDLMPILTLDEPWHTDSLPRYALKLYAVASNRGPGFSHSLGRKPSPAAPSSHP